MTSTDLLSKLVCTKCNHHLSFFPIYLSRNQEKICGRCHVPEEDWSHVRNEIYEEVAQDLSFPCRYKMKGCLATYAPAAIPDHEKICQYRIIDCATSNFSECTWQGPFANLAQHCTTDHSDLVNEILSMDFKDSFERHHIFKYKDDLFLIKLDYNVRTNALSATCTSLGIEPEIISKYSCKLVLTNRYVSTSMSLVIGTIFENQSSTITLDHVKTGTSDVNGNIQILETIEGQKAQKELLVELKCPVCFEHMTGPIYQCPVGHSLCDRCEPNVSSCPTCRSNLDDPARNYTLEKIANLLLFPCKNSETAGCNYISEPSLVRNHEELCLFGVHRCPSLSDCAWNDSWKSLPLHIEKYHSDSLLEKNSKCVSVGGSYFDKERVDCNFLMISRNLNFLVKFYCDKKSFFWEIQLLGPAEEVENYNFEIQVRSESNVLIGLMRTPCCSFQWGPVKPNREFARLAVGSVVRFISDSLSFTYRINLLN